MIRIPRSLSALALVVALVAVACGGNAAPAPAVTPAPPPTTSPSTAPSPSPSGSATGEAVYKEINAQVQAIRGLDEKTPVTPTIVSSEELAKVLQDSFSTDYPPKQVAADELMYHALGLLPKDQKLGEVYLDLLESQVAGLYDPKTKSLYVLSKEGGVGPVEKVFYSHEYDHALQDQHFDLNKVQDGLEDQSDTLLAHQSLVEGDAYVTMTYWLQQHLSPAEISEVITASQDPATQAALAKIPQIVQAQILFSATQGTQWVLAMQLQGGWSAVDEAFGKLPASTEQILHPEKYASGEAPIPVDLPDDLATNLGSGWSLSQENTLGEHQMSIWLGAPTTASATAAAEGWGGDRIAVLSGPNGAWAVAWQTVWDSADDAAEFETAADAAVAKAGGPGAVLPGVGGTTRWVVIGSDDKVLAKTSNVLGLAG
jgi:hypothetical protein